MKKLLHIFFLLPVLLQAQINLPTKDSVIAIAKRTAHDSIAGIRTDTSGHLIAVRNINGTLNADFNWDFQVTGLNSLPRTEDRLVNNHNLDSVAAKIRTEIAANGSGSGIAVQTIETYADMTAASTGQQKFVYVTTERSLYITGSDSARKVTTTARAFPAPPSTPGVLTGTSFSTDYYNSPDPTYNADKAFDASTSTFFSAVDAASSSNGTVYVGLDLGAAYTITKVRYYPRSTYGARLIGAIIEGSNTSSTSGYTTLTSLTSTDVEEGQYNEMTVSGSYRYIRIRKVNTNGNSNNGLDVMEMQIIGTP